MSLHTTAQTVYSFLRDFGGPLATVTVAIVATYVTARITHAQIRVAKIQTEINKDQFLLAPLKQRQELFDTVNKLLWDVYESIKSSQTIDYGYKSTKASNIIDQSVPFMNHQRIGEIRQIIRQCNLIYGRFETDDNWSYSDTITTISGLLQMMGELSGIKAQELKFHHFP